MLISFTKEIDNKNVHNSLEDVNFKINENMESFRSTIDSYENKIQECNISIYIYLYL